MPPNKGGNAKKESGRAKKAENEAKKADVAVKMKEAKEAEDWKDGAKGVSKADAAAAKQAEAARKKAERDALLAEEEAANPTKTKSAPKAGAKKKPTASNTIVPTAGAGLAGFTVSDPLGIRRADDDKTHELSATGIDGMLEALELVNERTDKQTLGTKAAAIEQHPERRFKAAFEAYLERETPQYREENPGLRANQIRDRLFKQFEKAPENPFNQVKMAYNATKEEKLDKLQELRDAREAKYKVETS